jgi:hypothetical protein
LTAIAIIINKSRDVRSIRVYGPLLGQKISGNLVTRYPNMVMAGKVHLVNWSILFPPVSKLDPVKFLWDLWNRSNDWPTYDDYQFTIVNKYD